MTSGTVGHWSNLNHSSARTIEVHFMGNTKKTALGGVVDGGDGEVGGEVDEITHFACERRSGGAAGVRERLSDL
jgi:hypothetical protein